MLLGDTHGSVFSTGRARGIVGKLSDIDCLTIGEFASRVALWDVAKQYFVLNRELNIDLAKWLNQFDHFRVFRNA
jgi:hypothetical protein